LRKKRPYLMEQQRSWLGDSRLIRAPRDRESMRYKQVQDWPSSNILGVASKGSVDPKQRPAQRDSAAILAHRTAGKILHETVGNDAPRHAILALRAHDQRIGKQPGERLLSVVVRRLIGGPACREASR
jgi:hypothetical protein